MLSPQLQLHAINEPGDCDRREPAHEERAPPCSLDWLHSRSKRKNIVELRYKRAPLPVDTASCVALAFQGCTAPQVATSHDR